MAALSTIGFAFRVPYGAESGYALPRDYFTKVVERQETEDCGSSLIRRAACRVPLEAAIGPADNVPEIAHRKPEKMREAVDQ